MPKQIQNLISFWKRRPRDRRIYFSSAFLVFSLLGITFSFGGQTSVKHTSRINYPSFQTYNKTSVKVKTSSTPTPTIKTKQTVINKAVVNNPTPIPTKSVSSPLPTVNPNPSSPTNTQELTAVPTVVPTQALSTSTPQSSSASDILNALNSYRQEHGVGSLSWDNRLAAFAQSRAEYFMQTKGLDGHAGYKSFQEANLGVNYMNMGENSSYGYNVSATDLIRNIYGNSSGHNQNQLNPAYKVVGIGYSGTASDVIFGNPK